jgi:threonine dehydrogenase-like Zn-dependent dehydrogenase
MANVWRRQPSSRLVRTDVTSTAQVIADTFFENSSAPGAYTLTAASGSFAVSGTAATLRAARKMAAAAGTVSVTGTAAGLKDTITDETGAAVNIASASTKTLTFRKPSGKVVPQTAVLVNTGTDGKMKYVAVAGDIDETGVWSWQGRVAVSGGDWKTDIFQFTVQPVL